MIPVGLLVLATAAGQPAEPTLLDKDSAGVSHYPSWSMPALKHLHEECNITASGHETRTPIQAWPPPKTIIRWRLTS